MSCKPARLTAHPCADIFPLLEGEPFEKLVADIKANGLRQAITIHEGMILDGRNRFQACKAAGVEPRFVEYDGGDPLSFVLSLNLHRRHLDPSQRSLIASRLANMRQGERTDLQPSANLLKVSQAEAAKRLSVSERSVTFAALVEKEATPDLVRAVEQGKIPVSVAAGLARAPGAVQRQAVAKPEHAHVLVKQERRAQRESELGAKQLALPARRYGIIYADPPWKFEVFSEDSGQGRTAESHYPTMPLESIAQIPVGSIADDDCVLFMWTTSPTMPEAFDLLKEWGFAYRSQCIWAKDKFGLGFWFRNQHEILIVAIKGTVPAPAHGAQWSSLIQAARGRHSEKPAVFYDLIEAYFPNLPKIELFARGKARPGWAVYGNEAEDTA